MLDFNGAELYWITLLYVKERFEAFSNIHFITLGQIGSFILALTFQSFLLS